MCWKPLILHDRVSQAAGVRVSMAQKIKVWTMVFHFLRLTPVSLLTDNVNLRKLFNFSGLTFQSVKRSR